MTLSLTFAQDLELGRILGLPTHFIGSAQLPNADVNFNLSPTFGVELAEIVPDVPDGYAIDLDISTSDLVGAVQT